MQFRPPNDKDIGKEVEVRGIVSGSGSRSGSKQWLRVIYAGRVHASYKNIGDTYCGIRERGDTGINTAFYQEARIEG